MTLVVGEQRGAVQPLQALLEPDGIPRIGVAAEEPGGHRVEGHVVGLVAAVANLAEQEVAHRVQDAFRHGGMQRHVRDQLQHGGPVAGQRGGRDLGGVDVAGGLDAATHRVGLLHDLEAGTGRRAAHRHDLHQVRDARVGRCLPARAHLHHERDGDHRGGRVLPHQHREPVRQPGAVDREGVGPRGRRGEEQQQRDQGREESPRAHRPAPALGSKASRP